MRVRFVERFGGETLCEGDLAAADLVPRRGVVQSVKDVVNEFVNTPLPEPYLLTIDKAGTVAARTASYEARHRERQGEK